MKTILPFILFCTFVQSSFSQCGEPITLPYITDAESANVPDLPDCFYSGHLAFSSYKIFQTTNTPVAGFTGNVFVYDTTVSEGITENAGVGVTLGAAQIAFEENTPYQVSFRYGMGNPEGNIGMLRIMLAREGEYIYLHEQENIAAGTVSNFVSPPFMVAEADSYYFIIEIQTEGGQGNLYLDDIAIQEASSMGVEDRNTGNTVIYPNPVRDVLNISNSIEVDKVEIYGVNGQKVYNFQTSSATAIDISSLPAGVYIVNVHSAGAVEKLKVIKI